MYHLLPRPFCLPAVRCLINVLSLIVYMVLLPSLRSLRSLAAGDELALAVVRTVLAHHGDVVAVQ